MTVRERELGFEVKRDRAIFTCQRCAATLDLAINASKVIPELIVNSAKHRGWTAHFRRASRTLCPTCTTLRPVNDTDSELRSFAAKLSNGGFPMPTPTNVETLRLPASAENMFKVIELLKPHWNTLRGCYHDGWSDQRIATDARVPIDDVIDLRTRIVGPIKVTENELRLEKELAALKADFDKWRASGEVLARRLDVALGDKPTSQGQAA